MKHLLSIFLATPLLAQVPINSDVSVKGAITATGSLTGSSLVSSANGGVMRFFTQGSGQASILPSTDVSGYTTLDILSVFSSTRLGQARLRVYGPATTDWTRYSLLSHDGTNGVVGTGSGGLVCSLAGAEQARLTSSGNLLLGTTSDSGERWKVQGNAAISGTLAVGSTVTAPSFSGNLTGNASTVTNGVYTTGSYSDPSWLVLSKSKDSDGVQQSVSEALSPSGTRNSNTAPVLIGNRAQLDRGFDGWIDELRLSNVARPSSWVVASRNNQNDPGTFYAIVSEAVVPQARPRLIFVSDQ